MLTDCFTSFYSGGRINSHAGNIQFRDMINARKKDYLAKSTKKLEKAHIAAKIVEEIRSMDPPGRFLKEDSDTGMWWDIGDQKAIKKSGQALREDAPDLRQEIDGEDADSGDNEDTKPTPKKEITPVKESKQAQEFSEPKPMVSTNNAPKIQIPQSTHSIASVRGNVKTPVASNNSRDVDSCPLLRELPSASPPTQIAGAQQNTQAPQVFLMNDVGAGMAYADYMQRLQVQQQQQQVVPPQATQYMVIPFPQSLVTAPSASTSNANNPRNSPSIYNVPAQLFQGVKSFAQKATNYSEKASEVMQAPPPHPFASAVSPAAAVGDNLMMMSRRPPSNVAFGRAFHPPTELSSGSTMSTISGLSSVMGPEGSLLSLSSHRSFGMAGGTVLSGLDYVDQQQQSQAAAAAAVARANALRASQAKQDQRRLSQLSEVRGASGSDLTFSLRSLGSLSRSHSFPDLSNSIREEMRMFEEAFACNNMPGDMSVATMSMARSVAPKDSTNSREGSPESGTGRPLQAVRNERPPTASSRSISTASAMSLSVASISLASGASRGSEASLNRFPIPDDSNRSIFSDLSNDIVALDLAGTQR